jgi:hypothetical protein
LEKLFLTAARTVKDTDLIAIAQFCSSLKQLDLLGNSYITSEGCCRQVTNLNLKINVRILFLQRHLNFQK